MMERLWAPWRLRYVTGSAKGPECVFCAAAADDGPAADHVLARGETCFSILNAFPYNNGHLMVVPYYHVAALPEVSEAARAEMIRTAGHWTELIAACMGAEGFNVGLNLGAVAGAGIAAHIHLHVVPRWHGDTNFMPVVGETKVLPEDLQTTCARLREAWQEQFGES